MKKLCPIHGIYTAASKRSRCPSCAAQSNRMYDKVYRNKEASKFYHSREWRQARDRHLKKHPLCVVCNRPADIVDHKDEISDGGCKLCPENLQSMCQTHHNQKTADTTKRRGGAVESLQTQSPHTEPPTISLGKPFSGGTL